MSPRTARLVLWLVLIVTLPLPFTGVQTGFGPVLRLLFIGGFTGLIAIGDPDMVTLLVSGLMLAQGLFWAGILFGVAHAVTRWATDAAGRTRLGPIAALAALAIVLSLFPVYRLPFSSSGPQANLFGVFD